MNEQVWGILLAAGTGERLGYSHAGLPKQFIKWKGLPLYWHSLAVFARAGVDGVILVVPAGWLERTHQEVERLGHKLNPGIPVIICPGGEERVDSVRNGIRELPQECAKILVHDAARPFLTATLARQVIAALSSATPVVIPGVEVADTIKVLKTGADGEVAHTLPRAQLRAVQTPQGFMADVLRKMHASRQPDAAPVTDDAMLWERMGGSVKVIPGCNANVKITVPEDLARLGGGLPQGIPCSAMGYDVHRYGKGRPLRLGGVEIPFELEIVAHSDGDVVLHSLMDALLGVACLGDIGQHFPVADKTYEGISSAILLDHVLDLTLQRNIELTHVDCTVVAQRPTLAPWAGQIRRNIASLLGLEESMVSFKATTEERLGFTGSLEGIKAYSLVTAVKMPSQT